MTDTAVTMASENNLPTKSLAELKVEIKFHLGQMAGHAIEIGKCLIQAKAQVPRGEFGKWLEDNFNLKKSMAYNFMKIAERFSNFHLNGNFNQTQLVEMLVLPAGEEEKFIAEMASDGHPVEDMTVKTLREQVAKWKSDYEKKNSEVEKLAGDKEGLSQLVTDGKNKLAELQAENVELNKRVDDVMEHSAKLQSENEELKMQLETQEPMIELPDDYEPLKKERDDLQHRVEELERQLEEKPIEYEIPSDYDSNKQALADMQAKIDETSELAVMAQVIDDISRQMESIMYAPQFSKAMEYYGKKYPQEYDGFIRRLDYFYKKIIEE